MDKSMLVALIVLVATIGWLVNNWIRARHGYPLEDEWGGKSEKIASDEAPRLARENELLSDRIEMMEDRLAVLERIITDKGYDVAQQIEALRDEPGSGQRLGRSRSIQN